MDKLSPLFERSRGSSRRRGEAPEEVALLTKDIETISQTIGRPVSIFCPASSNQF
jgi:hypothetical protein